MAESADLLIMGAKPLPALGRFAPEGTLYQVIAEALCPVANICFGIREMPAHHF